MLRRLLGIFVSSTLRVSLLLRRGLVGLESRVSIQILSLELPSSVVEWQTRCKIRNLALETGKVKDLRSLNFEVARGQQTDHDQKGPAAAAASAEAGAAAAAAVPVLVWVCCPPVARGQRTNCHSTGLAAVAAVPAVAVARCPVAKGDALLVQHAVLVSILEKDRLRFVHSRLLRFVNSSQASFLGDSHQI